jgi:hypothetical protein
MFMGMDTIGINSSLLNIRCQGDDKILLEGVLFKTDTLKMIFSISDKITKIGRTASKEIATPTLDIITLALSQPEKLASWQVVISIYVKAIMDVTVRIKQNMLIGSCIVL